MNPDSVLELRKLSKSFGSTAALSSIDLDIRRNQVLGIVGENGAGKTTLLNIVSGIVRPDAGTMRLHNRDFAPTDYAEAARSGISRVFQEQALIPNIRVYENLFLSYEAEFTTAGQWLRSRDMIEAAEAVMRQAGAQIDVRRITSELSFSQRQLVEIVRACVVSSFVLKLDSPVVLLDEPTASLERADEGVFFDLLQSLRNRGSLVFISHRLTEVLTISDRIAVLKDGKLVAVVSPREADEHRLHALMVGREREADYYHEDRQVDVEDRPVVFSLRGLAHPGLYEDIHLEVRGGEVFGIGGLLASGKSPLGKGASGVVPADRGAISIAGAQGPGSGIASLIRKGLGYVPAERLTEGMIGAFPVSWNISLASGADLFSSRLGIWDIGKEQTAARTAIDRLAIKATSPNALCSTLSGGNQQKVILARWLCRDLKILILDNPTRGVDAGAKEEIYGIIRDLTHHGVAILLISDELLELIGLSNRIAIMQHGRITAVIDAPPGAKPGEQQLIQLMLTPPQSSSARAERRPFG